jgi:GH15 family glucan-1,4-alpha-glucosidase
VALDGSIDWLCLPRFDSPSVFAGILDDKKGGVFRLAPTAEPVARRQLYWPGTNVLVTTFLSPDGVGEVPDFMPVFNRSSQLGRRVRVPRGCMAFRMECRPAFNYARNRHETHLLPQAASFTSEGLHLGLAGSHPLCP